MENKVKFISSFFNLLIISISLIFACGCSQQYKLERLVYQADRYSETIFINQGSASSYEFEHARQLYEHIVQKVPQTKYAINAQFKIAQLYLFEKLFSEACDMYEEIAANAEYDNDQKAAALFLQAKAYEKSGDWHKALEIFEKVRITYPKTLQSLNIPLYIARYYIKESKNESAAKAYAEAITYYQNIADQYKGTKICAMCEHLIVEAYLEQKDWQGVIAYVNQLDLKYGLAPDSLLLLAAVYVEELHNKEKGLEIYKRILEDFPEHKLIEIVKQKIQEIEDYNLE
ncbi:MAG: hypothetical protein DRP78_05265 [Candidatus Omnitrophota bacterium]|nr:MAG: hypothetical protein DRP78_05265 [Candidatus Omnitrophota bacterium]